MIDHGHNIHCTLPKIIMVVIPRTLVTYQRISKTQIQSGQWRFWNADEIRDTYLY
jgi:hypothetical protein